MEDDVRVNNFRWDRSCKLSSWFYYVGYLNMRVEVRNNNVEKALRILKKKLQQEGIFNELREREFFMTKGEKGRKSRAAAVRRESKTLQKRLEDFGY